MVCVGLLTNVGNVLTSTGMGSILTDRLHSQRQGAGCGGHAKAACCTMPDSHVVLASLARFQWLQLFPVSLGWVVLV